MCPVYAEYEQIHAMYLIPTPHKPPHLHPPYPGDATRARGAGGVVMGPDCSVQALDPPSLRYRAGRPEQRSKPAQQRAPCARRPRGFLGTAADSSRSESDPKRLYKHPHAAAGARAASRQQQLYNAPHWYKDPPWRGRDASAVGHRQTQRMRAIAAPAREKGS